MNLSLAARPVWRPVRVMIGPRWVTWPSPFVFVEEGSVVVPVDLSDVGDAVFVDTVFAVQAFGGHVFTPRILIFDSESP